MKRYCIALLFFINAVMAPINYVRAANSDIWALTGQGTLNNVDVVRVDAVGNVLISSSTAGALTTITQQGNIISSGTITHVGNDIISSPSDLYFGSASVAASSATTAGTSQGIIFTALLGGTVNAVEGSAMMASTQTIGGGITVMVSSAQTNAPIVGIAAAAASTGSVVNVFAYGWVNALTTGTVVPGSMLMSSSFTANGGYLAPAVPVADFSISSGIVAIALSSGPITGGLTKVKLR